MSNQKLIEEIVIPKDVAVLLDKKTGANSIAYPLELPDNTHAVLIITRLKDEIWEPYKTINKITIEWQSNPKKE